MNVKTTIAVAVGLAVLLAASPALGDIATRTVASYRIDGGGDIVVSVDIHNDGAENAYALAGALFMDGRVLFQDALGDNPGGGRIHTRFAVGGRNLKPGTYTAVLRISFEEQSGRRHRAYHPVPIVYRPDASGPEPMPIKAKTVDPVFNPRTFWGNRKDIELRLENKGSEPLDARIAVWYPDGFSIRPDVGRTAIAGRSQEVFRFSAELSGAEQSAHYYIVVDAGNEAHHHSSVVRGLLSVSPRPVYFRIYVALAAAGALLVAAWILLRQR